MNKDDLISRQQAIDALGEEPEVWNDTDEEIAERNQWRIDIAAIKAVPSAESAQKKGKWIKDNPISLPYCSVCGNNVIGIRGFYYQLTPFCPHCGADMRGKKNGTN